MPIAHASKKTLFMFADTDTEEVLSVDIRYVNGERTATPLKEHNYLPEYLHGS
jgi:hypothetical protein